MSGRAAAPLVVATALLGLTGCGGADDEPVLRVYAAASLRAAFTDLGERFERDHPGVDVALTVAGSADLATQITEGAPADVLAAADTATTARLAEEGLVPEQPEAFATNTLSIVTGLGNPAGVTSFADLADAGLDVVVCAEQVPCGAAARAAERVTGTRLSPVSEEGSVTDVLAKVASGEADAGLVYATDAAAATDRVAAVPFPEAGQVVTTCTVSPLADADEPELARAFADLVTGPVGRRVLAEAGFGPPPATAP